MLQVSQRVDCPAYLSAGHARTVAKLFPCRPKASSLRRRGAPVTPRAFLRSGPTGLDVKDENGRAYRPTSRGGWEIMSNTLKEKELNFVAPQEIAFAREKGIPIIDIRPAKEYNQGHIEGSVNVQFYRYIENKSTWQMMRTAMFVFFGVIGTEPNPSFMDEIREAVPDPRGGAILICSLGGHLDDYGPSPYGMQTRSLMAAYELLVHGFEKIGVLKGGVNEWRKQERNLIVVE